MYVSNSAGWDLRDPYYIVACPMGALLSALGTRALTSHECGKCQGDAKKEVLGDGQRRGTNLAID